MYSKTIIIGEEGNNDNSIYSSKKVVDVFDRVDFNAVTALVGKKRYKAAITFLRGLNPPGVNI